MNIVKSCESLRAPMRRPHCQDMALNLLNRLKGTKANKESLKKIITGDKSKPQRPRRTVYEMKNVHKATKIRREKTKEKRELASMKKHDKKKTRKSKK